MSKRECGILLPVFCLPSPYGIGAFSKEAYDFVDRLAQAGQSRWQILPLGPTGYGDSPYQPFSSFAGNPYFIDLAQLVEQGFLTKEECEETDFGEDERRVDYAKLYNGRFPLLRKAFLSWRDRQRQNGLSDAQIAADLSRKLDEETKEYCFFMALKNAFGGAAWNTWEDDIRFRRAETVARYRAELSDEILFYEFLQAQFQEQWLRLKNYANRKKIRIIGDLPIYVAADSADCWAHPELFQFDPELRPSAVAGCPPDAFSATGQLWGNPLYDWRRHKSTGYEWWMRRLAYSFTMYDTVRLDHFRGFDEYYSIPYGHATAQYGHWEPGPGCEFFKAVKKRFGKPDIIAEDLGLLTPSVLDLLKETGFPGMKVLEFAFDPSENSSYLPHKYGKNCVVYTGTHDNTTLQGWYPTLDETTKAFTVRYLGNSRTPRGEIHWDFVRLALSSVARLAIIPLQDYVGLGDWARINAPATDSGNWQWRMIPSDFSENLAKKCRLMARTYGRLPEGEW